MQIDHLVVCAEKLEDGVALVEKTFGVAMAPGGKHMFMGTHNRLLSLGTSAYLEVISVDPDAGPPGRARWFGLDDYCGPPRLTNWVARCDDLGGVLAQAPPGMGQIEALARGDLRWSMAVSDDGALPFDGAFAGLIAWHGAAHPAKRLPDRACRLERLRLWHPEADDLRASLEPLMDLAGIEIAAAPVMRIQAQIATPRGVILL